MGAISPRTINEFMSPDGFVYDYWNHFSHLPASELGDTPYDIEAAARANVRAIAFRSGGWSDEALRGAVEIYDGPADLLAIMTFGGFGYAKEYHVERLFREVSITRLAPITEQLILCFIAEKVLELPKSY